MTYFPLFSTCASEYYFYGLSATSNVLKEWIGVTYIWKIPEPLYGNNDLGPQYYTKNIHRTKEICD